MASGPEHYKEAERLLAKLPESTAGGAYERSLLGEAQVHATLAAAMGTFGSVDDSGIQRHRDDDREWNLAVTREVVTPNGQ